MIKPFFIASILLTLVLTAWEDEYAPKPKAYARITLPEPAYIAPNEATWNCPYFFEASRISYLTVDPRHKQQNCWYNIYYPSLKATIHLTYSDLDGNLSNQIEDSRKLAMKHIGKATQINESLVENDSMRVYGIVYEFRGETASDLQFFLTDSTHHFLRGSLYFNVKPNKDSLAPVIDYVKEDIRHMIQTFSWKNDSANAAAL